MKWKPDRLTLPMSNESRKIPVALLLFSICSFTISVFVGYALIVQKNLLQNLREHGAPSDFALFLAIVVLLIFGLSGIYNFLIQICKTKLTLNEEGVSYTRIGLFKSMNENWHVPFDEILGIQQTTYVHEHGHNTDVGSGTSYVYTVVLKRNEHGDIVIFHGPLHEAEEAADDFCTLLNLKRLPDIVNYEGKETEV